MIIIVIILTTNQLTYTNSWFSTRKLTKTLTLTFAVKSIGKSFSLALQTPRNISSPCDTNNHGVKALKDASTTKKGSDSYLNITKEKMEVTETQPTNASSTLGLSFERYKAHGLTKYKSM